MSLPVHEPVLLRSGHGDDSNALETLRRDPRVLVFDELRQQLRSLVATRHPAGELTPQEIDEGAGALLADRRLEEFGVWAYYPWSRRLVHLLDEPEFAELRTDRNRCKITADEQAVLGRWRVGVAGLSVGRSVAATLALERGFGEIRLADFDDLDLSNLNRVRAGVHELGLPKVVITAREIAEIDPFLKVVCFADGLTDANIDSFLSDGRDLDLVIDECDSLDIKLMLRERCRSRAIPVVMDTSDRGLVDVERFDLEPERPPFHGRSDGLTADDVRGLTTEEKLPHVLRIVGQETLSSRAAASLLEVGRSIKTWPQLASGVALGGAAAADVSRRIALGQPVASGRYFVDLEKLVGGGAERREQDVAESNRTALREDRVGPTPVPSRDFSWRSDDAVALDEARLGRIVAAAAMAPSGGNLQPWRWVRDGSLLLLFLDRARCSRHLDFECGGGLLSLGAATENLVLAAHHERLGVRVRPFPDPGAVDLVAAFEFFSDAASGDQPHEFDELYAFVTRRQTNRRNGTRVPLPPGTLEDLVTAVRSVAGADVQMLTSAEALAEIGDLLGSADRLRILDPTFGSELVSELRWTSAEAAATRDGIDVDTLECSPAERAGLEICRRREPLELIRRWGSGGRLVDGARKAIDAASAVALVTMPGTRPIDYFEGGRAVERAWLHATRAGLSIHPMTALPYLFARLVRGKGDGLGSDLVAALRKLRGRYRALFDVGDETGEIMLFRIGRAGEASLRSRRRPIGEILTTCE